MPKKVAGLASKLLKFLSYDELADDTKTHTEFEHTPGTLELVEFAMNETKVNLN